MDAGASGAGSDRAWRPGCVSVERDTRGPVGEAGNADPRAGSLIALLDLTFARAVYCRPAGQALARCRDQNESRGGYRVDRGDDMVHLIQLGLLGVVADLDARWVSGD